MSKWPNASFIDYPKAFVERPPFEFYQYGSFDVQKHYAIVKRALNITSDLNVKLPDGSNKYEYINLFGIYVCVSDLIFKLKALVIA